MKAYSDYAPFLPEDFLKDPAFRAWVAHPTPEMNAYWQGLVQTYPHLQKSFDQAKLLAQGFEVSWTPFSKAYTHQLFQRIRPHLDSVSKPPGQSNQRVGRRTYLRYAAGVAVILLLSGLCVYSYYFRGSVYRTPYAQTRTLRLYDGSVVTLNAHSRLVVPSRHDWERARTVELDGEAYFSVAKQASPTVQRKFTVHTDRVAVEVLGTQFNLYARPRRTTVLLDEGRIQLVERGTNRRLLMRPGQVVDLATPRAGTSLVDVTPEQARQATGWRHNLLVFNEADMAELAGRFRDVYGLDLVLEGNAFDGQQFRGELPVDDVQEALLILSKTFERKAIRDGTRVYFVPTK